MINLFSRKKGKKKNVIMITADALRSDIVEKLPFLGNLISKSTFFSNLTTYQNNSTGAFYSIFTGIYGNRNGANSYFGSVTYKRSECKTITQYFKEKGYFTIGHGMSDIILPEDGFEKYYAELNESKIQELYENMIKEIKDSNKNFFVHFHVAIIHSRIIENVAKKFKYNDKEYYKRVEKNKKEYFKYALEADNRIKNILEQFDLSDCIIAIFSDHSTTYGEKFGERFYGSLCYDDSIRTFVIFHGKDFPTFKNNDVLRTIDIMPTILNVLNIKIDNKFMDMDGKSLIPIINGEKEERVAFSEVAPLDGASDYPSPKKPNLHSVRTNKWKLIFNSTLNKYELYNIENDPKEEKDLFGKRKDLFGKSLKEEKEIIEILKKYIEK